MMDAKILDSRSDDGSHCYLCSVALEDYVREFVKLNLVADGKQVHEMKSYTAEPRVLLRDAMSLDLDYQQHAELIAVLSEYNSRHELFSKYLTLYHVFENFMIKAPICEMQQRNAGLTIRDFRILTAKVTADELPTLEKFFKKVAQEKPDGATSFEDEVATRWTSLVANVTAAEVDKAMALLDVKGDTGSSLRHSEVNAGNAGRFFPRIVYQLRNAIVHNKETDFHLTHATMTLGLERLLTDSVIPLLEGLCFHLITTKNAHVWYSNKHLRLYE
jgi:hypothetical protein